MRTFNDSLEEMGMKERPAGSKKLDVDAIENPELVGMVGKRLDNLNKMTGRVSGKNPAALDVDDDDLTPDDDDTDIEEDDTDDDQATSDDGDDDSTPEEKDEDEDDDVEDDKKKDKGVEVPDAYVRAAIHSGWKEEDIEAFVKANPEVANKTFENLYNSTNKASREWAAIGRAAKQEVHKDQKPEED